MGLGERFVADFLPSHLHDLALDVVTIGSSAIRPAVVILLSSVDTPFYAKKAALTTKDGGSSLDAMASRKRS